MKKNILTIALAICISSLAFSQAAPNTTSKAKTILDNVSAKTKSYSTIKISFTFVHQTKEAGSKAEKANGTLSLKGNKYHLTLLGNSLYCDGTTVWTHMIEDKEVTIASLNGQKDDVFNPAKMLTMYETGFKYKFIQERFDQNIAIYIIDLFPKEVDKSQYSKIRLYINKDKSQIWKIEYFAKDQNNYTIIVNTFEPNLPINDSEFKFDKTKFPGVQITDER